LGILTDIPSAFVRLVFDFLKGWAKYLVQASGVALALVFSPSLEAGADVRLYSNYFIIAYAASVVGFRLAFRRSWWTIEYAKLFFRFVYWFLAIIASIFAPKVLLFTPFLTLAGLVPKLAIVILLLLLLSFVGVWLRLSDVLKDAEERMIARHRKLISTPDYEANLVGEEFEHHSKPPPTLKERLRKWLLEV
jgi:hypothetical protein